MLHFGVNRVIENSLHITSISGTLWWVETILEGQINEEIGLCCKFSQCSRHFAYM
jgi:hypothetical protein